MNDIPPLPPEGSKGRLLWNKLNLVCYPWENFKVEYSILGWTITILMYQRWVKIYYRVEISDEMLQRIEDLDGYVNKIIGKLRYDLTMKILEEYQGVT